MSMPSQSTLMYTNVRFLYFKIFLAETYDNLIGFVTKIDENKGIEKIDGYARYGSLLKIHKSEVSGYRVSER